jgi:ComF family protein
MYCSTCCDATLRIRAPFCPRCGRPQDTSRVCLKCAVEPPELDGIRSVALFEGTLRGAIHQFKYSYMRDLAVPLGELLVSYCQETPLAADVIVPVPLHVRRLAERGYNQAALLAQYLGSALGIPVYCDCLRRSRYTESQTRLNAQERSRNVDGAFACTRSGIRGARVLLVDDVCTTGATLGACGRALEQGGARSVWALTVARAMPAQDN